MLFATRIGPEKISHFIKMAEIQRGIAGVERHPRPIARIKEAPPQRALQQIEPHQRHVVGLSALVPIARPVRLDLADAFEHKFIVGAMRAAMQGHADTARDIFGSWQHLAIAPKIMNAQTLNPQLRHERGKRGNLENLPGDQMMPLQIGGIAGFSGDVNAPERQLAPLMPRRFPA